MIFWVEVDAKLGARLHLDALEAQARPCVTDQLNPVVVGHGLVDRPSGDCRVELRQLTWASTVDGCPGKAADPSHRPNYFTTARRLGASHMAVSYTHLRAHETVLDLVC